MSKPENVDSDRFERARAALASAWRFEGAFEGGADTILNPEGYTLWLATRLHHIGAILRDCPECLEWLRSQPPCKFRGWLLAAASNCPLSFFQDCFSGLTNIEENSLIAWLAFVGSQMADLLPIPPNNQPAQPRLSFDLVTFSITLDGISYQMTPTGFYIVKVLSDARNAILSSCQIQEQIPGCKGDQRTLTRYIKKLPLPLRACIQAKAGAGRWLQLPPKK